MKQARTVDGRIILIRNDTAVLSRQDSCQFSDGSSVYYQVFSDGVVFTGYFNASGRWSFAEPSLVNEFFGLAGDGLLDSRAVIVDGHEACVLRKAWKQLCGSVTGEVIAAEAVAAGAG